MKSFNVTVVVMYDKETGQASLYSVNGVAKCFDTLYDAECKRDEIVRQNKNIVARVANMWV